MGTIGDFFKNLWEFLKEAFSDLGFSGIEGAGMLYTAIARWVFILLALFIVSKSIASLLKGRSAPEVFAYFNIGGRKTYPITHWENTIGRSKSSDLKINDDPAVSRTQGTLTRDDKGNWKYMDMGSSNGSVVNGKILKKDDIRFLKELPKLALTILVKIITKQISCVTINLYKYLYIKLNFIKSF